MRALIKASRATRPRNTGKEAGVSDRSWQAERFERQQPGLRSSTNRTLCTLDSSRSGDAVGWEVEITAQLLVGLPGATDTGARPRRVALSGVDSLTPSERRVAELAAEGPTNGEIAQALFVTQEDGRGALDEHLPQARDQFALATRGRARRTGPHLALRRRAPL
jgi:hypothetical protein